MLSSSRLTFGRFVPFLAVLWIPWGVTASVLRRGIGVPLDRWFAMLAAMAVVLGFDWESSIMRMRTAPISASTLLLLAAWLHDGGRSWRSVWPMTVMVFGVGAALRLRVDDPAIAALGAALPAVAILAGLLIHQALAYRAQPWSLAVRAALAMLLVTLDTAAFRLMIVPRMRGAGSIGAADFAAAYYTSVAAAIALLLATALLVRGYAAFAQRARTARYSSSMNG
jgi:hypothetical protein